MVAAVRSGLADAWANPDRYGTEGRRSRAVLDGAREAIADVIGARPERVFFTPSPALAFERAVAGMVTARRGYDRVAVSAIERDALTAAAAHAAPHQVDDIAVDGAGHVMPEALAAALAGRRTAVAAIQHANQEIATVQRLDQLAPIVAEAGVPLLVDATASLGHIDPPEHWTALVADPADFGGPAGLGIVAMAPGARWLPAWPEGDDWAPGGVNVALALASAVALQEREEARAAEYQRLGNLVETVRHHAATWEGVEVLGDPAERLPHVVTFSCLYVDGEVLLGHLDRMGFAVGSGSACARGSLEPSRVLAAVGALTHGNVRLSLHPGVSEQDVLDFIEVMPRTLAEVRAQRGAPPL